MYSRYTKKNATLFENLLTQLCDSCTRPDTLLTTAQLAMQTFIATIVATVVLWLGTWQVPPQHFGLNICNSIVALPVHPPGFLWANPLRCRVQMVKDTVALPAVVSINVSFTARTTPWHQVVHVHVSITDLAIFWQAFGVPTPVILHKILAPAILSVYQQLYNDMPPAAPIEQSALAVQEAVVTALTETFRPSGGVNTAVSASRLVHTGATTAVAASADTIIIPPYPHSAPLGILKIVSCNVDTADSPSSFDEFYEKWKSNPLKVRQQNQEFELENTRLKLEFSLAHTAALSRIEIAKRQAEESEIESVQHAINERRMIAARGGIDGHVAIVGSTHTIHGLGEASTYVAA
jgi:hypothetical protein